ncbi:hypothetical protein MUP51_09185, partial [Candidatus Bathyarchaeota archaeon]|nr:hypothetical protein [Candidatus Bathyarchaeota archaeon]
MVFTFYVLVSPSTPVYTQDNFIYRGKVSDSEGNPIQGIQVQVYDLNIVQTPDNTGLLVKTVKTGRDGTYTIALHCSSFKFTYMKDGYITESRVIENSFTSNINLGTQNMQRTIDLKIPVTSRVAYPGEQLNIPIEISNNGEKVEIITVNATSATSWQLTIQDNMGEITEITLTPGSTINLDLVVNVPHEANGSTTININALSHVQLTKTLCIIVQEEPPKIVECLYPSRVGTQDDTVDFTVTINNPFAYTSEITLSTSGLPPGWEASWMNTDQEKINSVSLPSGASIDVTLRVGMPQTASEGVYLFKAYAEAQGRQSNASLSIRVERRVLALELSTRYPVQEVEMGQSLTYRLKLCNPGGTDETISLSGKTLQDGWRIAFTNDAGAYIQSVLLEAWGEEYITAVVEPATDAEPGRYEIFV